MGMTEGLPQKLKINSEIERWGKGARSEIGVTDRNTDCERECVCVCAQMSGRHTPSQLLDKLSQPETVAGCDAVPQLYPAFALASSKS